MDRFADNLSRLLGVHHTSHIQLSKLLGISISAMSKWQMGTRMPSFSTALKVAEFFQVPTDRLARAEFEDLLANELADSDRFKAVEAKIHRGTTGLKAVR